MNKDFSILKKYVIVQKTKGLYMKKFLILAMTTIAGIATAAEVNMPSSTPIYFPEVKEQNYNIAPSTQQYKKTNYTKPQTPMTIAQPTATSNTSTKAQLDTLAMAALKAAERRNESEMQTYLRKMSEKGVTGISAPQIIAKQTPQCPPIKMELNGKMLSGSLCAQIGYEYNNQEYWLGYCK